MEAESETDVLRRAQSRLAHARHSAMIPPASLGSPMMQSGDDSLITDSDGVLQMARQQVLAEKEKLKAKAREINDRLLPTTSS